MKFPKTIGLPIVSACRPPRGGRGLKSVWAGISPEEKIVAPLAGGVD